MADIQAYQITYTAKEVEQLLTKINNTEHELKDSDNPICAGAVLAEINELKKSVSDGKKIVASAITDKGIDTAATQTFKEFAENIRAITSGSSVPEAIGVTSIEIPISKYIATDGTVFEDYNDRLNYDIAQNTTTIKTIEVPEEDIVVSGIATINTKVNAYIATDGTVFYYYNDYLNYITNTNTDLTLITLSEEDIDIIDMIEIEMEEV